MPNSEEKELQTDRILRIRKKDSAHLVWDTKPHRAPNPKDIEFQTAEVVIPNPHRDEKQIPLSFRDGLIGEADIDKQKMNRLIWGDNLLAMQSLLSQGYEGKINLIYIDPPFDSKADYSHKLTIGNNEIVKEPSVIERLAYKDTWAGGTDSYLDMLYPRLQLMKRLLSDDGSIYVHCDWHANSYIRILLDEIFGKDNFRNEIVWHYQQGTKPKSDFGRKHDNILRYTKTDSPVFNQIRLPTTDPDRYKYVDENGRHYVLGGTGMKTKYYADDARPCDDVWSWLDIEGARITQINQIAIERTEFITQKPKTLIERIMISSSNEGSLVADFFCGSGTTLAVAEKLNRRWIGCELGKVGIQITRTRLVNQEAKPFLIENIGNYQREMIYLTGVKIYEMQKIVLKLYGATPRNDYKELGMKKVEDEIAELVYVGYPDRPTTARKVEELSKQAEKLDGSGYKKVVILAWDYEYNFTELLEQRLHNYEKRVVLKTIPPEIYEYLKRVKDEEEIEPLREKVNFFEKPYLKIGKPVIKDAPSKQAEVKIKIERYVLFDIPVKKDEEREKLLKLVKDNFALFIDYWAIDWDYDGFTFKSTWQDFRGNGKNAKVVSTEATNTVNKGKKYMIAIRVVDIFGNDATSIVEVDLRK